MKLAYIGFVIGIAMALTVLPGYMIIPWPKGFDNFYGQCSGLPNQPMNYSGPPCNHPPTALQQFSVEWIVIGFFGGIGLASISGWLLLGETKPT